MNKSYGNREQEYRDQATGHRRNLIGEKKNYMNCRAVRRV